MPTTERPNKIRARAKGLVVIDGPVSAAAAINNMSVENKVCSKTQL